MEESINPPPPLTTFSLFSELPTEIRLKIWDFACCQPRNIALNNEFYRDEGADSIFYTERYFSILTPLRAPAILSVSQESRAEALNYYQMQFRTRTPFPSYECMTSGHASSGLWINYRCDRLVPRGFYNIVGMESFLGHARRNLRSMAIDIIGQLYSDMFTYLFLKTLWPFEVMDEIILYDGNDFAPFKKGYRGGKIEFAFRDLLNPSELLQSAHDRLCRCLDAVDQKTKAENGEAENEKELDLPYMPCLTTGVFKRPRVRIMQPFEGTTDLMIG
jgi:hypothetical protein